MRPLTLSHSLTANEGFLVQGAVPLPATSGTTMACGFDDPILALLALTANADGLERDARLS